MSVYVSTQAELRVRLELLCCFLLSLSLIQFRFQEFLAWFWCSTYLNMFSSSCRIVNWSYFSWLAFTHGLFFIQYNSTAPAVKIHQQTKPPALVGTWWFCTSCKKLSPTSDEKKHGKIHWNVSENRITYCWYGNPMGNVMSGFGVSRSWTNPTWIRSKLETTTWFQGWWWLFFS